MKHDETTLAAATVATLAEAVAVGLFIAAIVVWIAIYGSRPI